MIKIYQGGSTGLEQQKAKRYPQKRKPSEYKLPNLKDTIKGKHDVDVVLMAGGGGYTAVEEDAKTMNKVCGHKIFDNQPYEQTRFFYNGKSSVIKKLEEASLNYVILDVVDHDNVIREIVHSSNQKLIGLKYAT
tara:strand:- start:66 stop:467 length:402 start_codon:yes stop_codon:yes gene_type:complete